MHRYSHKNHGYNFKLRPRDPRSIFFINILWVAFNIIWCDSTQEIEWYLSYCSSHLRFREKPCPWYWRGTFHSPRPRVFINIEKTTAHITTKFSIRIPIPTKSGRRVKIVTPGHLMSGHQVTLYDLISQRILAISDLPQWQSWPSDFSLTLQSQMNTPMATISMSHILAVCCLMSWKFLRSPHCESKWAHLEILFTFMVLIGSVLFGRDNDNWDCS